MEKNVCIVHFNTPELTVAAIKSLWKNTPDCKVTVFDNSDKFPFPGMDNVTVIDNTKGQIIDFDCFLKQYPDRMSNTENDWGSAKHCYTIQKLWDYYPDGFVLMDSDVVVINDISSLFDQELVFVGAVSVLKKNSRTTRRRLYPFICWINVPVCTKLGIRYFDEKRNWGLIHSVEPNDWYDTGASFLEDCLRNNVCYSTICIKKYIKHFGGGSWREGKDVQKWLEENKKYYE